MKNQRIVGIFAALVGVGYVSIGASHFALPAAQLSSSRDVFASLQRDGSIVFRLHYWAVALTSLLSIGLVLTLRPESPAPPSFALRLARVWAIIAFAVTALDFLYVQHHAVLIAASWASLDSSAKSALLALGTGHLDPTWFLSFGLAALWPLALSATAIRTNAWPRPTAWLGITIGLTYLSICIGALTGIFAFINLAAAAAIVLSPLFCGSLAVLYLRNKTAA